MSEQSLRRSSPSDLRLILLGNIGCGKTSSADTILGQPSHTSSSDSKSCQQRQGFSDGRNVTLVEAPRWYWNGGKMEESVRKETERAMTLVAPGPHAVLLLVPVGQFTEMEGRVPAELEDLFGTEVLDHTLVLLTCGDYLLRRTKEEYLQTEQPGLRQIIERCGGRYHVLNNRRRQDREQVHELAEKVDSMVQKNGLYIRKTDQERELEKRVKERKRELMESYTAQKEETRRAKASRSISDRVDQGEESVSILERMRREERDETEGKVVEIQVSNSLCSAPTPEPQSYSQPRDDRLLNKTPSYRLNADGATLSQISEVKSTPKITYTLHHRINSFEEKTPESSPTSSPPPSPVFSPSTHSSPKFTVSPSLFSTSSSSASSSSLSSSSPELRLVLLGRSGAGKSAAGNSILGQEVFDSRPDSFTTITQKCEKQKALVDGRKVAVVDTPDWFNSEQTPEEVRAQISSCVALSSPGPHAFLLCVPLDQPAKTELQALGAFETVFGSAAVQRHTVVLFTYADRLRESGTAGNNSVEDYIASQRGDLLKLVEKCGDRFHVMEMGEGWREKRNVAELLETVEQTVKEAGGQCYSSPAFQEAENKVRQKQLEISRERRGKRPEQDRIGDARRLSSERQGLYSCMQPVDEAEEDTREEEIEKTRDEAEMSVSTINLESLPPITHSTMSPSLLCSIMEKMESSAKMLPKLLSDSSALFGEGAKKVKSSPVWGKVGSGAQNVQKVVVDSSVWQKFGATAEQVSKAVGDRVPKVVVDGSAWVGSGAKAMGASPMWEKVGSGAKLVADSSMRVGSGIGAGAKNLAQSSVWGKVGSGAKTGAKLVADGSVKVGAGLGAGAKKVVQSPVWGKVGSGTKMGIEMVAESSVWEKIGASAKRVPKVVIGGLLLGLVLGVFLGGMIGGAVGAAAGSAVTEVGRRKFSNKNTSEKMDEATRNVQGMMNNGVDGVIKEGGKSLKTE
ncbi:GTPase IMAP family member 8 [Odontesthes bonariensis]|uniref:GTPase IMAP family member 8 n=1 Tax=Odontesthes bonariensis TaxID=219752 RepID=UPI003F58874D